MSTTQPISFKPSPVRAIHMCSGGLDSQLAACVLRAQGVEVHLLAFQSVFFGAARPKAAAEQLGMPLRIEPFTADIVSLVKQPTHGYGSELNPCIDCHAAMIRRAGQIMERDGYHLISTGEVLNQRPMSQNRQALAVVARDSGYPDFILRPLSAQHLPLTEPEKRGWIDRDKLLALEGRNRKPQMALAKQYGILKYPQPAGGCLLTEPSFTSRLRDLMSHEGLDDVTLIERLHIGRHFRLGSARLVVGRNKADNDALAASARPDDVLLQPRELRGPTALLSAGASPAELQLAAEICARYCDCEGHPTVVIHVRAGANLTELAVTPADPAAVDPLKR